MHRSAPYDQAFFITTTAVAYRLFVLYTFFKLDEDEGHIRSAQPIINSVLTQLSKSRDRIAHEMSPWTQYGFSCGSKSISKSGGGYREWLLEEQNGGRQLLFTCYGTEKGRRITDSYSAIYSAYEESAADFEVDRVQGQVREALAPFTEPLQRRHDEFLKNADSALYRIYACYRAMCHEAGLQYEYPENIGPVPANTIVSLPNVVSMPGATVGE